MTIGIIIYSTLVLAASLVLLLRGYFWLNRYERRRREILKKRKPGVPVETESPVDDPQKQVRARAIDSLEAHFTVTRRLFLPMVMIAAALALVLPFLPRIPATIVSVVVAAVTVVVGIAARPIVENAMAGLVVSFSKIVNVGDTVRIQGDKYGIIEDISPTHTIVKLWDWRRFVIPNSRMLQEDIINYSLYDKYLWAYAEFWVAYDADIDRVREIAETAPQASEYFADHESPKFWVMEMSREGFRCWIAAWANNASDAWYLGADIRTELIRQFQRNGIHTHGLRHAIGTGDRYPQPELLTDVSNC